MATAAAQIVTKLASLEAKSRNGSLSDHETLLLMLAIERTGFRKGQKRWLNGDVRRLHRYLLRGKKPAQIAPLMGRTERAIWRVMNLLGWTVRLAETGELPKPPKDLSGLRRRVQLQIVE